MGGERARPPGRTAGIRRRVRRGRPPRPARTRVSAAAAGAACCPRVPPLPRPHPARDRRSARRAPGHGEVAVALRHQRAPRRHRGGPADGRAHRGATGMTTDRDVDRITAQFLRDGPAELADRVLDDALDEIHLTRQRRRLAVPWRNRPMSSFSLRLAAVIAVIAVGGVALFQLGRGPTIAGPATPLPATPLPTVPASLTAVASAAPSAAATPVPPTPPASAALLAPFGYAGGGTIAFTRDDAAVRGSAPFLIDPSGKNEARIVIQHGWGSAASLPGTGCCGVFSPDGSKLAVGYDEVNPARGAGTHAATQIFTRYGFSLSLIPMVCGACAMIEGVDFVPRAWSAAEHGLLALDFTSTADPTRAGVGLAPMDGLSVGWQTQVT